MARILFLMLASLWCGFSVAWQETSSHAEPPAAAADSQTQVLYLHTELLPYQPTTKGDLPYRLGREIVRQAVLLAARDELGLATCDQTLDEAPPDDAEVIHLHLIERANLNKKWNVKLIAHEEGQNIHEAKPLWEKTYDYDARGTVLYADMIPKLEVDSRGEIVEALRTAGLGGEKPAVTNSALPTEEIEEQLRKVDFIAQFGAVRAAHQAIAESGETPEWLSVLVRGYANLAMLTQHQWNTSSEAFTARAWLYAQRMLAADEQNELALWHRAYAWALGGTLHHALTDMELIKELRAERGGENAYDDPPWTKLIEPYASSDRAATKQIGADDEELNPWATHLWFQLTNYYRYSSWIYHAAGEVAQICPTAYGVYSEMAHHGGALAVTRTGAGMAPLAYGRFASESLDFLPQLPPEIRAQLPTDLDNRALLANTYGDPNPDDQFSAVPTFIAAKLRERSKQQAEGDLSWSVLAFLLDEEQFVQIANYLNIATNATESSLVDEVESLLPLVKDHRFAAYVDSYRFQRRRDHKQLQELLTHIKITDPRRNMTGMMVRMWTITGPNGQQLGQTAFGAAQRNFTMPGTIESLFVNNSDWSPTNLKFARILAREVSTIAPGSEIATRMTIQAAENPQPEQLRKWEAMLSEDPTAYTTLARHYDAQDDTDSAIRCYEKSLASLPTLNAARELANLHWDRDDHAKWEQTLLAFLETEDLGLQHAQANQQLAFGYISRGLWAKAKPHAKQAGETWSAWGLEIAAHVCEGLAEWEQSEEWIREMSTNYPSSSGDTWYLWCRRTGRGDVAAARKLAERFHAGTPPAPTREQFIALGAFLLLEKDNRRALEAYRKALAFRPSFTCTFMIAQLARELGDEEERSEVLAAMEEAVEELNDDPNYLSLYDPAGLAVVELFKSGDASPERLATIDEELQKLQPLERRAFSYFIGRELAALGKPAEAESYWRRELVIPNYDRYYATLAGAELAKLHGTSRPDDDALTEDELWAIQATE